MGETVHQQFDCYSALGKCLVFQWGKVHEDLTVTTCQVSIDKVLYSCGLEGMSTPALGNTPCPSLDIHFA